MKPHNPVVRQLTQAELAKAFNNTVKGTIMGEIYARGYLSAYIIPFNPQLN